MATLPLCVSPGGEFVVHSSHDGVIKVWETATNSLKTEYKPASHLSASCSCLSWWEKDEDSESPKKKKKKERRNSSINVSGVLEELKTVAIGTISGTILLYSVVKGDLHSQLDEGHNDRVNDISWYSSSNTLYSCSDDTNIVEWEITSAKIKHKWKADKGPVHSLCRCSKSHLLSASRTIKLWDLSTRQVLMVFTGHATEVFRLLHIPRLDGSPSIDSSYFLSSAVNDRVVNVWQINTSNGEKNALASFSMSEEPVSVQVSSRKDKPIVLVVVTKCGKALLFEHKLNGKLKKPLKPKLTIQVASGSGKDEVPRPVQILSAYICDEKEHQLMLMHGNRMRPTFEKLSSKTTESELVLVREDPMRTAVKRDGSTNVTKTKTPDVSKDMTLLVPGHSVPMLPTQDEHSTARRRKRKASGEMTMEDRLNAISITKPQGENEPPRADTMATLLSQGLYSQDKTIINSVLIKRNATLIKNTVKKLPLQMVIPLVQELTRRMQLSHNKATTSLLWIKSLLEVHTSYLMTFPQIIETLSSLYQMLDTRVVVFGKLSRLQGKLDLLLSQVSAQTQEEEEPKLSQQALLQFEEDSSDDDLDDIPLGIGASDSEENWDDFSDDDEEEMETQYKDSKG